MKVLSQLENEQEIKKPSLSKFLSEPFRAFAEKRRAHQFLKKYDTPPQGDKHPILVIPGFMGDDQATLLLRKYLNRLGYTPIPWGLGWNFGKIQKINLLQKKIEQLHKEHQREVTLIGWSLGGVYARQLAKANPQLIRQVISLGSPFAGMNQPNNAAWLYKLINGQRTIADADQKWLVDIPSPPPVRTTALFSKKDGIVPWQACIDLPSSELHQNIEIDGSHNGMPHNVQTWKVIETCLLEQVNTERKK